MSNPTPEQVKNFLEQRGFKIYDAEKNYVVPSNLGPYVTIPKYVSEIGPTLLEKILNKIGISSGEFKQEYQG